MVQTKVLEFGSKSKTAKALKSKNLSAFILQSYL